MERIEIYQDKAEEWRWRMLAGNNKKVANGGEGYTNKQDMLDSIEFVLGGWIRSLGQEVALDGEAAQEIIVLSRYGGDLLRLVTVEE